MFLNIAEIYEIKIPVRDKILIIIVSPPDRHYSEDDKWN